MTGRERRLRIIETQDKLADLKKKIQDMGSLAIAFSGGLDSTFLLKVAHDILHEKVLAIIAHSATFPEREFRQAEDFVRERNIRYVVINSRELELAGFTTNPLDRCYICKKELFREIVAIARKNGISHIADGANLDDLSDYRPGMLATKELQVVSPLKDCGFTKNDIRLLAREMGLSVWDKPSFACLASRFPYGQEITAEKLVMVERAEQYLLDLGFRQVRVRHHGDLARIEVAFEERQKFFSEKMMDEVYAELKKIGFTYVALDLKGYRTGSMNENIQGEKTV
jgi:uncharacterized protein